LDSIIEKLPTQIIKLKGEENHSNWGS